MSKTVSGSGAARPPSEDLRKGVLGIGAITFLVVSAAGPLMAIAGGFPIAMMLGNGRREVRGLKARFGGCRSCKPVSQRSKA